MATTTDVRVPLADGTELKAAYAAPGTGAFPGVIVLHEVFGLNGDIRRITGRFADEGYAAVAPDLYSHGPRLRCLTRLLTDATGQKGTLDDVEAVRQWLIAREDVDGARVGVIGFCMGGGFALLVGAQGGVKVAGVNYGRVPKDRSLVEGVCPVIGSFGGRDRIFGDDARRLEDHLTALGVPHDVKVYDGVGHSFLSYDNGPAWMARIPSPMHAGYDEPAAEDAWRRILAFFADHL